MKKPANKMTSVESEGTPLTGNVGCLVDTPVAAGFVGVGVFVAFTIIMSVGAGVLVGVTLGASVRLGVGV